jgi:hypothetical protein
MQPTRFAPGPFALAFAFLSVIPSEARNLLSLLPLPRRGTAAL